MSDDNSRPDVVVVGMPSCGKTVFFTVLGKKFTSRVDGKRVAPLGFRMSTCDNQTSDVVEDAYGRLVAGKWPQATDRGNILPLKWEVLTGRRRVFTLSSMDIAGEDFRRAFIFERGDKVSDGGQDDSSDFLMGGTAISAQSKGKRAVDILKKAISTAKVVCFMVNVALSDGKDVDVRDELWEKKRRRFISLVQNIYHTLNQDPGLRSKSVIVLSQVHLHEGEIERAGGPLMYLGEVCGGAASELHNLAKDYDIPVIAVSSINEARVDDDLPRISSPDDIKSSGWACQGKRRVSAVSASACRLP